MDDCNKGRRVTEENRVRNSKSQPQVNSSSSARWLNGQCVLSISSSVLNPNFDLGLCRLSLDRDGFQIPESDLEAPLRTALCVPSVRRYITFNSSLFHFLLAPVLYIVLWCAVFSTLHMYLTVTDYWVLCLSVSLIAIFLTTALIFILHQSNKEINMNLDVRLIAVNEGLLKHNLQVAVADWVENCTWNLQLYFVYWDMSRCLRALTETLDERDSEVNNTQANVDIESSMELPLQFGKKLQKRMSHLVLVSETPQTDPESGSGSGPSHTETEESPPELDTDEHRPLLHSRACGAPSAQKGAHQVTTSFTLVPDPALTAQAKAHQLLMTYSASYLKLLVTERLSGPSHYRMRPRRNHCARASLCLCQYIRTKIIR